MNIRFILLCLLMSTGFTAGFANNVVIYAANSRQYVISLDENPKMTLDNGMLNVKSDKTEVSVPLQEVSGYCFQIQTGAAAVEASEPSFVFTEDRIIFNECGHARNVSVCAPNGTVVARQIIDAGPGGYFDTSGLASGVYLVNVDGTTIKIVKR